MEIYQAAFENAPDPILFVDGNGRIIRINPEGERIFGYLPGELTGASVDLLVPARFGGTHLKQREAYMEAPHKRAMGSGMNLFARRKDDSDFPVEIMLSPAHTSEGTRIIAIAPTSPAGRLRRNASASSCSATPYPPRRPRRGYQGVEDGPQHRAHQDAGRLQARQVLGDIWLWKKSSAPAPWP